MTSERNMACPVCNTLATFPLPTGDARKVQCPTCGTYTITGTLKAIIKDITNLHILSGVLRANSEDGITTKVTSENIQELMASASAPNDSIEAIDFILRYIKNKSGRAGEYINLNTNNDYPIAFAKNAQEFEYLLKQAIEKKYVKPRSEIHKGTYECYLTIAGEKRLSEMNGEYLQEEPEVDWTLADKIYEKEEDVFSPQS